MVATEIEPPQSWNVTLRRGFVGWLGWLTMSEWDLRRIDVLAEVSAGRRTIVVAAAVLSLSARQLHRLLLAYRRGAAAQISNTACT